MDPKKPKTGGLLHWRIFIFADVNTQDAVIMGLFYVLYEVINAKIIKAHTVDQTFGIYQTKETRLVITWLWTWRDGTDLDRSKSHRA